jgi:hypothetical protein
MWAARNILELLQFFLGVFIVFVFILANSDLLDISSLIEQTFEVARQLLLYRTLTM